MFKRPRDPKQEARQATDNELALWSASKRWPLAIAIGGLPFVFILDQSRDWGFSPVLPGVLVLLAVALLGPFILMEWNLFRRAKKDAVRRTVSAERKKARSRTALIIAGVWAFAWLGVAV